MLLMLLMLLHLLFLWNRRMEKVSLHFFLGRCCCLFCFRTALIAITVAIAIIAIIVIIAAFNLDFLVFIATFNLEFLVGGGLLRLIGVDLSCGYFNAPALFQGPNDQEWSNDQPDSNDDTKRVVEGLAGIVDRHRVEVDQEAVA